MSSAVIELQFLPCIGFFSLLKHHGHDLRIEAHENYQKKGLRNRTQVLHAGQKQTLSVPLVKGKNQQMPIRQVTLAYDEDWPSRIIKSLHTAYGNSAFFRFYIDDIAHILHKRYETLWELNIDLLNMLCDKLDLPRPGFSDRYEKKISNDFRGVFGTSKEHTQSISYPMYPQNISSKSEFIPNLSIVDLLFQMGPEAKWYLGSRAE